MSEESFWAKAKRSVKGFFTGAVKSAPMTLLYTGTALVGSAALGTYVNPNLDFLHVIGSDGPRFATRLLGGAVVGTVFSGVVNGVQSYSTPEAPQPTAGGGPARSNTPVRQRSNGMGMDEVVVPFTPQSGRAEARAK